MGWTVLPDKPARLSRDFGRDDHNRKDGEETLHLSFLSLASDTTMDLGDGNRRETESVGPCFEKAYRLPFAVQEIDCNIRVNNDPPPHRFPRFRQPLRNSPTAGISSRSDQIPAISSRSSARSTVPVLASRSSMAWRIRSLWLTPAAAARTPTCPPRNRPSRTTRLHAYPAGESGAGRRPPWGRTCCRTHGECRG